MLQLRVTSHDMCVTGMKAWYIFRSKLGGSLILLDRGNVHRRELARGQDVCLFLRALSGIR